MKVQVKYNKQTSKEFQDRFKGRTSLMNKDGHIGIVSNTNKPITKINNEPLTEKNNSNITTPAPLNTQKLPEGSIAHRMLTNSSKNLF